VFVNIVHEQCSGTLFNQFCSRTLFNQFCSRTLFNQFCSRTLFNQFCSRTLFNQFCSLTLFALVCTRLYTHFSLKKKTRTKTVTQLHASRPWKDFTPPYRAALSQKYSVASFATLRVLRCLYSTGLRCS
jgi:hypothetical protein